MIDIDIRSNVKEIAGFLRFVEKKQVRYATMVALTRTANDAQQAVIGEIPKRFNVTKKWWLPRQPTGIKRKIAKKDDLKSIVFTDAYFLPLQEEGGIKTGYKGHGLLIPTKHTPRYGRKSGGARRLLAGKRVLRQGGKAHGSPIFAMDSGKKGCFRREGKKRLPIQLIYNYRESAPIKPRLGFEETIRKVVLKQFDKHFSEMLMAALRSKR
jgi:hypothetical protein